MSKLINLDINTESFKKCINSINYINKNEMKEGYKLISKYPNTYDLRNDKYLCPLYHYDDSFFKILIENNIFNELEKLSGKKMYLCHIQYRNAYKNNMSYQSWHRDTSYQGNNKIQGSMPPVYKAIFYPPLNKVKETCLNIIENSNLTYKNEGINYQDYDINQLNKKYSDYKEKNIDVYPDNKLLIFDTSLYHNACMPIKNEYQTRIIYSFTTDINKINNIITNNKGDFDITLVKCNFNK